MDIKFPVKALVKDEDQVSDECFGKVSSEPSVQETITSNEINEELDELLEQKKMIEKHHEEELAKEMEERYEEATNNVNILLTWMASHSTSQNLYGDFRKNFHEEYRIRLFEDIYQFFNADQLVTNDVLFYWKLLIIDLVKNSRKFRSCMQDLAVDMVDRETNLSITKEKYMFKCFVREGHLCYFKENGNDYYVS